MAASTLNGGSQGAGTRAVPLVRLPSLRFALVDV